MKILFVGKRFYTNRDALREKYGRIYQLPWHWAEAGIRTTLWLVDYHGRESVVERDGALDVVSTPVRDLSLLRHWLTGAYRKNGDPDVVVASGDCYIGWMASRIARRTHSRFVFDVYDKYDEFGGYRSLPGFDLFAYLLGKADVRCFASRALMNDLRRSTADCVVPNGLDVARFSPRDMHACRAEMGLPPDGLLVGYFGGMEPDRGAADLIEAVGLLRKEGVDARLVLGGKPPAGLDLDRPGVLYLGNVPYARMPTALSACDLLAVPYRRTPFMDAGSSNKIAEAIACRRPIVATRTPNLVANFPVQAARLDAVLAEPADAESLARSIRLQSEQRLLVDLPEGMAWKDIAGDLATRLEMADNS
jgi:glycosyltransferase involved in cell wall biosynthesis